MHTPDGPSARPARAAVSTDTNLILQEGAEIEASLYAGGSLLMGPRARAGAAVTALKGATLGEGVRIGGRLHVEGPLTVATGVSVAELNLQGPLLGEDGRTRATGVVARKGLRVTPRNGSKKGGDAA